ncbi:UNVERIFIED_CONTAM: cytochrome [Sesamum latifolium]|uniref:Cytochrome n=1 Tax=Sesamum latifolium TaxID=2727402 RepID=A0AAW2U0I3_9LAMI
MQDVYFASTDTIATTIIWAVTALIKNPSVLKKVQAELRALPTLQNKPMVEEEDIATARLPYFNAVIKEAAVFQRGKDPELWEKPFEFMPERFLGDERKLSLDLKGTDFGLIPFGAGRRGCPGITMALATVEIAMANLLYQFDWGLPDGMKKEDIDSDILPGMAMHKKNPLLLMAKKFV